MKSFSQFLQESYLNEEPEGRSARRRKPAKSVEQLKAEIDARDAAKASAKAAKGPTGAAAMPETQFKPQGKTTSVPSPTQQPIAPNYRPGEGRSPKPYSGTPSSPSARVEPVGTKYSQQTPSQATTRGGALALRPQGSTNITAPSSSAGKPPSGPKLKVPSGLGKVGRVAGKLVGPAAAALDVADEKSKGSGWARSLAKGAAVAAGGALGGAAGSVAGPVGSFAGATGGAMAASKAFDTAAGANAAQRKAMATANRQSQSGGAIKGIGGKTTFDTKKNTITTGTGAQRRTAQLGKTSVVTGPGGKQETGYLAYKGGKAVYKRADTKNLAQTSSNPLERIGRSLFAGAYKQSDAAAAANKLQQARASDVARNKALGVKMKPGG